MRTPVLIGNRETVFGRSWSFRFVLRDLRDSLKTTREKLHAKLNCTKKGNRAKKTLTREELKALIELLRKDTSTRGREDYALVFMLVTSGLGASELCVLRWGDLGELEGKWTALFIGKGDKEAEQELFEPAVQACRLYFLHQIRRIPRPEDALF
jgi:site-specific recombinase XerC